MAAPSASPSESRQAAPGAPGPLLAKLQRASDALMGESTTPLAFGFTYAGIAFSAEALRSGAPHLTIRGCVGTMPYSAEGLQRRIDLRSIIAASRDLPACRLTLTEAQQIWLTAEIAVEAPMTPTLLIAATAASLARCKPWLDMLRFYLSDDSPPAPAFLPGTLTPRAGPAPRRPFRAERG